MINQLQFVLYIYYVPLCCHFKAEHKKHFIFRPLNIREIKEEAKDIVYVDELNHECTLLCPPGKQNGSARKSITFVFDRYLMNDGNHGLCSCLGATTL